MCIPEWTLGRRSLCCTTSWVCETWRREFVKCTTEHGVYVRRSKSELLILCVYVDDLLITGSCKKEIEGFKGDSARNSKCPIWAKFHTSLASNSTRVVEA